MVLIEAPSSVPAQPIAKDPAGTATPDRSGHRPPPRPAAEPGKRANDFSDTVEDLTQYGTMKNSEDAVRSPASEEGLPGDPEFAPTDRDTLASSNVELPDPAWLSIAARQRRRWLLAGIAMVAGISLAIAVFVYLAGRTAQETTVVSPPTTTESTPPKSGNNEATTPPTTPEVPKTGLPVADSTSQPPAASSTTTVPPESPTIPIVGSETPAPVSSLPSTANKSVEEPSTTEPPKTAAPATAESTTPPELMPNDNDKAKADRVAPGGSLSDTLRKLGGLFDDPEETPRTEAVPAEPVTATPTDSATPAPAAEPAKLPRPTPRPIDVAGRLADPIAEIEFTDTPLQDFLQLVSNYSTIPVMLDPDVLVWMKLTPNTPVSLRLTNTTVAKLLDAALSKIGLIAVPVDNQLLVTRKAASGLRKARRNVADLIGDDRSQADELRAQVTALIAPESWAEAGGKGTIQIADGFVDVEQTDQVLLEISSFLERLRIARGLPKQSKFDEKLFQPISRTERAATQMGKSVTLNFSRPTSFPRIVRRLAEEATVSILVDWQAVAQAGWNPDAEVTLLVTDKPLKDALVSLLQPMELTYRIVDESTVQITTPAELDARPEIEFYRVGDLLGDNKEVDELLKRVRGAVPTGWFADSGGSGVLTFDLRSRCLLVLLSQPRQQMLEKLLHDWKPTSR